MRRSTPRPLVRLLPLVLLALALVAATYPAWRVVLLDDTPTMEELVALICSARTRR